MTIPTVMSLFGSKNYVHWVILLRWLAETIMIDVNEPYVP